MKTVAIVQARMGSTRVPGKVMRLLNGEPVLQWAIDAVRMAPGIDEVVLATSTLEADDVIAKYCSEVNVTCFRGSESDVLDRFYECAKALKADIALRLTADCPFLDPVIIGEVIKLREMTNADYASNCYPPTYPDGLDTECFTFAALEASWREATSPIDRDCLTQFIVRNRHRFKVVNLTCPLPGLIKERWVLDTEKDWEFCQKVAEGDCHANSYVDLLRFLDKNPHIRALNAGGIRNERFYESLATERLSPRTFARSQRVFERASKVIPLASQTLSKSFLQYPAGHAPLAVSHGDGGYVFDVDGNRYVDLVGALGPVVLGYCDDDVDAAIRAQLNNGISHSLATELETELAELLCRHIPCAEMVKFGKSGTDVTTAAIRAARAYRGRDHVFALGYHGWADWSMIQSDKRLGIPRVLNGLSHITDPFDPAIPKDHVAAIIVEPNDNPDLLKKLRELCDTHGIVLIFDEIITGFRYDLGGAQKLYGVTPDLACFGKAMGNGMPISALVGRREIMRMFEDQKLHYSGTFFGESLSLAAAIATIKKIEQNGVIANIWASCLIIEKEFSQLKIKHGLTDEISLQGIPGFSRLKFKTPQIQSLFMQTMIQNGVLIINSHMLSYAHRDPELRRVVTAYDATMKVIADAVTDGSINHVQPIKVLPLRAS